MPKTKPIDNLAFFQAKMKRYQKYDRILAMKRISVQATIQMCQNNILKEYIDRVANNYLEKWDGLHPSKIDPVLFSLIFCLKTKEKNYETPYYQISFDKSGIKPCIMYKDNEGKLTELLP